MDDKKQKKGSREHLSSFLGAASHGAVFFLCICFWEAVLYLAVHESFKGLSLWNIAFVPAIALFMCIFSAPFKGGKENSIFLFVQTLFLFVIYTAEVVYYYIFGSLITVSMVGMGDDAIADFGWTLAGTIDSKILPLTLLFVPILAVVIAVIWQILPTERQTRYSRLACFALSLVFWFTTVAILPAGGKGESTPYGAYHSRFIDTDTASEKIGVLPNAIVEIKSMIFKSKSQGFSQSGEKEKDPTLPVQTAYNRLDGIDFGILSQITENRLASDTFAYLDTVKPTEKNAYTGKLKGYNLIYICAESFSSMAVDKDVTPVLYRLANNGIVLDNYYNSFRNTTTNGEYAFLTGIWPDVSRDAMFGSSAGSMAQSAKKYMPIALGNQLNAALGVQSLGFHNFTGEYYYRKESLPNFGFDCKFMNAGMTFTTSWPSSDFEMMEQSVDDYLYSDEPFCAYYMTFSGHGSYAEDNPMYERNIDYVEEKTKGKGYSKRAKGYLACNYELEKALGYLLDRLEEAGKLNNTLIVLTGDHYPYYVNKTDRDKLSGHEVEENFELYKSTCIMWSGSLERNTIHVDVPCCNVDILPTVLNLLGIPYDSRLYAGVDIFSSAPHRAVLYNRSFITDMVMYDSGSSAAHWLVDISQYSEEELEEYLSANISAVNDRYQMSLNMASGDLYRIIYEYSGLTEDNG